MDMSRVAHRIDSCMASANRSIYTVYMLRGANMLTNRLMVVDAEIRIWARRVVNSMKSPLSLQENVLKPVRAFSGSTQHVVQSNLHSYTCELGRLIH
jgi:hypothetical protein